MVLQGTGEFRTVGGAKVLEHLAISMQAVFPDLVNEGSIVREPTLASKGALELFGGRVLAKRVDQHLCARVSVGLVFWHNSPAGTCLPLVPPRLHMPPCGLALMAIQCLPVHQGYQTALDGEGRHP